MEGQRLGRHRHVHVHIHLHVHIHVRVVLPSHVVCRASLLVGWVRWCGVVDVVVSKCVLVVCVVLSSRVAVVLLVSCYCLVVAVSSCGGPCLKSVLVS